MPLRPPENLVFSSGGLRGIAFVPALRELAAAVGGEERLLAGARGLAGSSAGALIALALTVGLGLDDVATLTDDDHLPEILPVWVSRRPELMPATVARVLRRCGFPASTTFAELRRATGRDLHVAAFAVRRARSEIFSAGSTPHDLVVDAVVASAGVGYVRRPTGRVELFLDGGLTLPLPLTVFPLETTLGLYLCGRLAAACSHIRFTPAERSRIIVIRLGAGSSPARHIAALAAKTAVATYLQTLGFPPSTTHSEQWQQQQQQQQEKPSPCARSAAATWRWSPVKGLSSSGGSP